MHHRSLLRFGLTAGLLALASCTSQPSRHVASFAAARSTNEAPVRSVMASGTVPSGALRSVIRVEVPEVVTADFERFRSGTGVYLGHGRVVTAHHVIADAASATPATSDVDDIRVLPWNVARSERDNLTELGGRVDGSPFLDLAVINAYKSPDFVQPARVAERRPAIGERVVAYGLGGGSLNQIREMKGRIVGRAMDGNFIAIDVPSIKGDSGGPVFNEQGELVGIILGGGPDYAPWRVDVFPERSLPFHFTYPDFDRARPIDGATLVLDLTTTLPPRLAREQGLTSQPRERLAEGQRPVSTDSDGRQGG